MAGSSISGSSSGSMNELHEGISTTVRSASFGKALRAGSGMASALLAFSTGELGRP
jgi:hypothetical protein